MLIVLAIRPRSEDLIAPANDLAGAIKLPARIQTMTNTTHVFSTEPSGKRRDLSLTFRKLVLYSLGSLVAYLLDRRPLLFDKLGKMRCARTRSIDHGISMPWD